MQDIIRSIKDHPILYENKKTPNLVKKKKQGWEEVALDLGQSVETVKKKWVYLRENYLKCLRDGKAKKWQWGKEMEFLRPHLKNLKDDNNISAHQDQHNGTSKDEDEEQTMRQKEHKVSSFVSRPGTPTSDDDYEEPVQKPSFKEHKSPQKMLKQEHKEHETPLKREISSEPTVDKPTPKIHKVKKTPFKREASSEPKVTEPTPKKSRVMNSTLDSDTGATAVTTPWNPSFDATELLFLGYAKTLKNFAPKNQAVAKMKIAKIIMEQELLQCDIDDRRNSFLDGF